MGRDAEAFSAASTWRRRGRRLSQSASEEASASPRRCCPSTMRPFATRASTMRRVSRRPSTWRRRLYFNHTVVAAGVWASAPRYRSLPAVLQGQHAAAIPELSAPTFCNSNVLRFVQICLTLLRTEVQPLLKLHIPGHVQMCLDRVHMKPVCMHL